MARILVIGGGGHARVVIEAIRAAATHEIAGIAASASAAGEIIDGVPVICTDEELARIRSEGVSSAVVAVGSVGDASARVRLAEAARNAGFDFPVIVHPRAYVAPTATVAEGAFIAAGAIVGTGAQIGAFAIINSLAVVDHDCRIGRFAHVAPGCALSGAAEVGDRTHVGVGSSVIQGVRIGRDTLVGAGAAVVEDLGDEVIAYGVPCKVIRSRS